ncbi:hypothetical protein VDG1235_1974 [Verrucomicrobiia bacterium DG1235]|nr:hypothetical protein VDG1235_1974 [Verrucomicrobiae bacterium DG1235]
MNSPFSGTAVFRSGSWEFETPAAPDASTTPALPGRFKKKHPVCKLLVECLNYEGPADERISNAAELAQKLRAELKLTEPKRKETKQEP